MLNSSSAARAQGVEWTRPYLAALCDEIGQALEAWAGEADADAPDLEQARASAGKLAASLAILNVSGAAGLVESLHQALDVIDEPDPETATVLLESVAVLPDYLERVETGGPDMPEALAPFIDRMRAAVGLEPIVRARAAAGIEALEEGGEKNSSDDYEVLDSQTLRRGYQRALRDWLKDSADIRGLDEFCLALQKTPHAQLRRLGRIAEAAFKGLAGGQLEPGPRIQAHLAALDQLLHRLGDEGEDEAVLSEADTVAESLLDDIQCALPGCPEIDRMCAVTAGDEAADPAELERARSVLSGRNRELFTAIAEAARGELNQAKDALNEFLLGRDTEGPDVSAQTVLLRSVSESFGMLGLDRLKQRVRQQADRLGELTADPENPVLLDLARELLLVESELEEAELYLGEAPESDLLEGDGEHLPKAEHRRVMRQLLSEALDDLGQAKHLLDQAHRGQADSDSAEQSGRILRRVAGVLHMAGQSVAAEMLEASASCIGDELADSANDDIDRERLEGLAEALVVVDFYLDSLTRLDTRGVEYLHDARDRLVALGYLGTPLESSAEAPGSSDSAWLDQASDADSEHEQPEPSEPFERLEADSAGADDEPLSIDFAELEAAEESEAGAEETPETESPKDFEYEEFEYKETEEPLEESEFAEAIEGDETSDGRPAGLEDQDIPTEEQPGSGAAQDEPVESAGTVASDSDDFDLMSIFLEEFDEELETLRKRFPEWREEPGNHSLLTDIRRSFHTLKGSGRMAGAERIGEFAWQIEQLLNQTLDGRFTPEQVVEVTGEAVEALPDLRAQLVDQSADLDDERIDSVLERVNRTGREIDLPELEGLDPTLVKLMVKEINDHLHTIDRWIETSRRQGWPADVHGDLIRSVHTIKGTLRLAPIGDEAQSVQLIEEYLQEVLDTDSEPAETAVGLMEDLRVLLGKRLERLEKQAVSTEHFSTGKLASEARALISALHQEVGRAEPTSSSDADMGADGPEVEFREVEAPEAEVPEAEVPEEEVPEAEVPEAEVPEVEVPEEEVPEEEVPEEEVPEEEVPEEEVLEEEVPEAEVPEAEGPEIAEEADSPEGAAIESEASEAESARREAEEDAFVDPASPEANRSESEISKQFDAVERASGGEVQFEEWPQQDATTEPEPVAEASADADGTAVDYASLDAELLELFLEEGHELLEHADDLLQQWRERPEDRQLVTALQRDIHTVKGSARMAGLNPIGEVAHVLEDLLEKISGGQQEATIASMETLESGCDHLHAMLDAVENRQPLPDRTVLDELTPADQVLDEEVSTPTRGDIEEAGVERTGRGSSIRLASQQVEELLNFAGEVSIFRSRIQQEIGSFRGNIGEVEQTVARLREQLRKLEQETEAQILSRYEREHGAPDATFDPLELDRYSTIQQLSRALAESVSDLNSLAELMDESGRQSETLLMQQARVNTELQEGLMQARMVSFNTLAPRLRRVVRNAARDTGRKASLEISLEGEGELDRTVLDRVTAPIEHILRNAIAHGIEAPSERRAAGKPEAGTIAITIDREATELLIRLVDDGAGLNLDRIRARALEMGLLTLEQAHDPDQLMQVIFQTGFSTADEVSELAGRGVGMDVVSSEVRQIGGRIAVDTTAGQGTCFTLRIPLSLAVMQAIFVHAGERLFAIPLQAIRGVARVSPAEWREALGADGIYRYGGEEYPLLELEPQLGFEPAAIGEESLSLLMVATGDQRAAVRVVDIQGHREVVLKPVGPQISSIPGILGGTIMGDGQVVVLLDMAPLIERALVEERLPGMAGTVTAAQTLDTREDQVKRTPLVMVVDDSITMRRVTARILEQHGLEVVTARDGVEAVDMLFERVPDLMLLDIEMPRMDGFELAAYVRADTRLAGVPIMMITSRSGDKHREHARELGVNRYLIKPYQETNMVRNVFEMLELPVPGSEE